LFICLDDWQVGAGSGGSSGRAFTAVQLRCGKIQTKYLQTMFVVLVSDWLAAPKVDCFFKDVTLL
jgi:hypothetical protein